MGLAVSILTMRVFKRALMGALMLDLLLTACSAPHFVPRERSLFPGLDEYSVAPARQPALKDAKEDFLLAQRGLVPAHAKPVSADTWGRVRVFDGEGYRVIVKEQDPLARHPKGPDIILYSSLTGAAPYHYDLVENLWNE